MATITYRMNYGVPGDISRVSNSVVEAQPYGATPFPAYGLPAKVSGGKMIPIAGTGDFVYGFLVRPFPTTGVNAADGLGVSVPPTVGIAGILRRGYLNVLVQLGGGSCALGSNVYIRYQNPSGSQIISGIEGASTGNTYQLTSSVSVGAAYFTGPTDANNNAEVAFNI